MVLWKLEAPSHMRGGTYLRPSRAASISAPDFSDILVFRSPVLQCPNELDAPHGWCKRMLTTLVQPKRSEERTVKDFDELCRRR